MGAVWRARQIELDADVAIKVLHAKTAQHAGAVSRFKREAKASASLRSPHVVQVVDYGVDEASGTAFIAMELLEGESLAARLVRERKLGPDETARWITHAARALTRAHAAGIVHRDLKPANIFIVRNEDEELAKVVDFGIAKLVGPGHGETATATGALLGTPLYMSPEQIDPSRGVDFRADLWSLAVIACECLTGRRPFEGDTLASLAMKISLGRAELPSSLGPVPRGFDAWFARGTEVAPERRFGSALELAVALREVVESGDLVVSAPTKAAQPATTRQELTPSILGFAARAPRSGETAGSRSAGRRTAALAAGALLIGGAGLWWGVSRAPAPQTAGPSETSAGAPSVVAAPLSTPPAASAADTPAPTLAGGGTSAGVRSAPAGPAVAAAAPRVGVVEPETRPSAASSAKRRETTSRPAPSRERRTRPRTGAARPSQSATPAPAPDKPVDPYDLL
jgi:serine/threonine-protein kinase